MTETIRIPDLGGADTVTVLEISVAPGDTIELEQTLLVLESDKATMDVPSPSTGVVEKVLVSEGDEVAEGDAILEVAISTAEDAGQSEAEPEPEAESAAPQQQQSEPQPAPENEPPRNTEESPVAQAEKDEVIRVPDLGGAETVTVLEISVAPGDTIELEQTLLVLESDKATMDVPSPVAGIVKQVLVKEGSEVSEGDAILELTVSVSGDAGQPERAAAADQPAAAAEPEPQPGPAAEAETQQPGGASEEPARLEVVRVPDLGGSEAVTVLEISVAEDEPVEQEQSLLVLESDKATMDVPSPMAGIVKRILLTEGSEVSEGDAILELLVTDKATQTASAPVTAEQQTQVSEPEKAPQPAAEPPPQQPAVVEKADNKGAVVNEGQYLSASEVYAGPAVRKLARELGVDLKKVKGTGPRQRVQPDDLHAYLKQAVKQLQSGSGGGEGIPPVPETDFSRYGSTEQVALTRIQQLTAKGMQRSWLNVPHVTHFDEADITDLEEHRKSLAESAGAEKPKLTLLPFLLLAVAKSLEENPAFNRALAADSKNFVQRQFFNVGMAVDTPNGLVVPVVKDVDQKDIWQLAEEILSLAEKARQGQLKPDEMKGACFTISSLGAIGGNGFTPIVNTPEAGILGVSRSQIKPVWSGTEFEPRLMLPLSLSYDHRIVNGADAGRFMATLTAELAAAARQ